MKGICYTCHPRVRSVPSLVEILSQTLVIITPRPRRGTCSLVTFTLITILSALKAVLSYDNDHPMLIPGALSNVPVSIYMYRRLLETEVIIIDPQLHSSEP